MKRILPLIIFFAIAYQCIAQEKDAKLNMHSGLKTNVKFSEKFDELRAEHAGKYRVDMVILNRVQMDAVTDPIFGGRSTVDSENDQSLFCIIRIYMKVDKSFNFIAHNLKINILDEDLMRHGFSRMQLGLCRPDEVIYKVIKFGVYAEERDKLLKKKEIDFFIDWLGFG